MIPSFLPLPLQQPAVTMITAALFGLTTLLSGEYNNNNNISLQATASSSSTTTIPVIEIIKVYGKLAGSECYGRQAPKGSSCEVTRNDIEKIFHLDDLEEEGSSSSSSSSKTTTTKIIITESEFNSALDEADFQWPLKPYGITKSNFKTATMNKGAETKVYMDLLEQRKMYDVHNPTGPLPTSLRPQLNSQLQKEGIPAEVTHKIFRLFGGDGINGVIEAGQIKQNIFGTKDSIDYYDFIDLVGKESITWPY